MVNSFDLLFEICSSNTVSIVVITFVMEDALTVYSPTGEIRGIDILEPKTSRIASTSRSPSS